MADALNWQDLTGQLASTQASMRDISQQEKQATQPLIQQTGQATAGGPSYARDVAAKERPTSPMPQMPNPQDMKSFGGIAMMFAALAGMFTRAPATASLNAFAAAAQGYYKGQQDKYQEELQNWQRLSNQAMAEHKKLMEAYQAALDEKGLNIEQLTGRIKLIQAEYNDQMGEKILEQQGILGMARLLEMRDNAAMRYSFMHNRMNASAAVQSATPAEVGKATTELRINKQFQDLDDKDVQATFAAMVADEAKAKEKQGIPFDQGVREAATELLKDPVWKDPAMRKKLVEPFHEKVFRLAGEVGQAITRTKPMAYAAADGRTLTRSQIETKAKELGVTPEQVIRQYGLKPTAE